MSTGYSGNLGFRMPVNWAFDQFAEISDGLEHTIDFDKVGYSGRDEGVSCLLSTPSEDATPEQFKPPIRNALARFKRICPFLTRLPLLLLFLKKKSRSSNLQTIELALSFLPKSSMNRRMGMHLSFSMSRMVPFRRVRRQASRIISTLSRRILTMRNFGMHMRVTTKTALKQQSICSAAWRLSVRTGKIYFSVVPDILNKTITYVLAATTDDFQVAANVSATFSMEIRIETRLDDDSNAGGIIDSFTTVNATDVVFGLLVAGALIGLFVAPQVELPAILSSLITLITSSLPALVAA